MDGRILSRDSKEGTTATADRIGRTTLDDSINGHRLFLGRFPKNVQETLLFADCTVGELLSGMLMLPEFKKGVLDRLTGGERLPHRALGKEMDEGLCAWASARLPLSDAARDALAGCRSWRVWLLTLLRDPQLLGCLPPEAARWLETLSLQSRLPAVTLKPTRHLSAEVSHNGAGWVAGWCANLHDLGETVVLEFHLGGRFVGAVRCDQFSPGLAERIGGRGEHGFGFEIPAVHRDLALRGASLAIRDAQSKGLVVPEMFIKCRLDAHTDQIGAMLAAITQIKEALRSIERQLPAALRSAAPMLHSYAELKAGGHLPFTAPTAAAHRDAPPAPVNVIVLEGLGGPAGLRRTLDSLDRQTHRPWTLTVVGPEEAAQASETADLLAAAARNRTVAAGTMGTLLRMVTETPALREAATHVVVESGAALREDALAVLLDAVGPGGLAYGDHDVHIDPRNGRAGPLVPVLKPDFDPVMLLAYDYVGPVLAADATALHRALAGADGAPPSGLHDLVLRLADTIPADGIRHVPSVLCTVRRALDTRGADALPWLLRGDPEAVRRWGARRGLALDVHAAPVASGFGFDSPHTVVVEPCAVEVRVASPPAVSVIVPTRNSPSLLRNCLDSLLRARHAYPGTVQILVIDHENTDPESVALITAMLTQRSIDVLPYRGPFNWSVMNNQAAAAATGNVLVFLNDDTVAIDHGWIRRAVSTLALPAVGAVGARLLYRDGSVQHAGVVTSPEQGAIHDGLGTPGNDADYLGRVMVLRSAAAVTGACLATRRTTFMALKGFDPDLPVNWNDVDFCLAVRQAGFQVVYDPAVCLHHHESKTRGYLFGDDSYNVHQADLVDLTHKWGDFLRDPFHNPNFSPLGRPFTRLKVF